MKTFLNKNWSKFNNVNSIYNFGKFFGANKRDTAAPKGIPLKSPPKVKDLIIWVNVINIDGSMRRIPGWPNESLSDCLARFNVENFHPECNGGSLYRKYSDDAVAATSAPGPKCGKCHVVVSDPWFTYMKPKIHPVEMTALEKTNQDVFPTSRLACCIGLKPWMSEVILRIHWDSDLHFEEELVDANSADSSIGGWGSTKLYPY